MATDKKFNLDGFSVDENNNVECSGGISTDGSISCETSLSVGSLPSTIAVFNSTDSSVNSPLSVYDVFSATGNVFFLGLPTSDPVDAGALWNDSGTLKISAG